NDDVPYNQFVKLQLAADQMRGVERDDLRALGYLGAGPIYHKDARLSRDVSETLYTDDWDERVDAVSRGILGLTVGCARCHDHKFDPILQKDYYALYGVFASTVEPQSLDLPILPYKPDPATEAEYHKQLDTLQVEVAKHLDKERQLYALRTLPLLGVPAVIPQDAAE